MKVARKILLWCVGMVATIATVIIDLQIFYKLTPSMLSSETLSLNERAALLPTVTENGYRLYGLMAPKDVDPVRYGKCLYDASNAHRTERQSLLAKAPAPSDRVAYDAYWKKFSDHEAALTVGCLEGGVRVKIPAELADLRIKLGMEPAQWQLLAAVEPDPIIVARAEAVWAGDARRLGAAPDSPVGSFQELLQLERWRTARALLLWPSDHMRAVAAWNRSINDWVKTADDTLIDAAVSIVALSQILIGMQDAISRSERVDDAAADAALKALASIESMPKAIGQTMVAEWQLVTEVTKLLQTKPSQSLLQGGEQRGFLSHAFDEALSLTHDVNDTLNRMAFGRQQAELALIAAAQGKVPPDTPLEALTPWCGEWGDWEYLCLPFSRNPTGRILAIIGVPSYSIYGVRVADLRNLAAATRLSIEARRRALTGNALRQFIDDAPEGMRDVFTGKPFAYDVASKRLRMELRTKSNVLGEKGSYVLAL